MNRFLHACAEKHPRLTQSILTRAAAFGTKRLIVFLTPGSEMRTGGVMAIGSYYRESLALRHIHGAKVVLCTLPGEGPFLKYRWFPNHNYILDLEAVLAACGDLDQLTIHVPAYTVDRIVDWLAASSPTWLNKVRELRLNILLMNIDNIQGKNVAGLKRFGTVTSIAAHEAYTNQATRDFMGVPLHRLSVCVGPEHYKRVRYADKDNLLIVSHDPHPLRDALLDQIARACPDLTVRTIQNLSYEEYRELTRRAKWSLTFGEGLDFYFIETVFSGGNAFAVFNERYFTPPFAHLETVYPSWDALIDRMRDDLRRLDEPAAYARCWQQSHDLLRELYNVEQFRDNLRKFYRGEYTFP